MNTEQLLREMPFYYLTDYDFIDNLSNDSQRVCDEMYENSNFYNSLLAVTKSELLQKLNFNYRTVDDFNNMLSSSVKNMEISVFHLNIRSLNKTMLICLLFFSY